MLDIKGKQELNTTNILSYRGTLKQEELENVEKEMEHSENRYKIGGNPPSNFVKQDIIQICQR